MRVDLQDAVDAHLLALDRSPALGFGRYIISATTPINEQDLADLRRDAASVVATRVPEFAEEWQHRGWRMYRHIDRVYVNERARQDLGWRPRFDFRHVVNSLRANANPGSALARAVGAKGYHRTVADT